MNKWAALLSTAALALTLAACGDKEKTADNASNASSGETYALKYQGETGIVTPAEVAEDLGYFKKVSLDYQGAYTGGPESIQFVATKQLDYGMAFNGAIIKSIDKGVKIKSVISSYGSNKEIFLGFFGQKGSKIKEPKDLIGKKVALNIRGAHYEMAVKQYLYNAGLTDKQIEQVQFVVLPQVNSEQAVINGQVDVAALNGIFRDKALESKNVDLLFKDVDAFEGQYNAGSYFFRDEFIKENPEVVKDFTQGVSKAIDWMKETDRDEVVARLEDIMEKRDRDEPIENLQYWQGTGINTKGGVIQESDFNQWRPLLKRLGDIQDGNVDTSTMYTNEFNPQK